MPPTTPPASWTTWAASRGFGPMAMVMVLVGFLLLKEPDFGAFVVIISIAMGILFLGGMRARLFVVLILVLAAASSR
jgi:cell division protein FtsW